MFTKYEYSTSYAKIYSEKRLSKIRKGSYQDKLKAS